MSKIIFVTLFVVFIFSSYTFALPYSLNKRQGDDPMSGYKPCEEGKTYPVTFTKLQFDPNPIVLGEPLTTTVAGKSTVTIEEGATSKSEAFFEGKSVFVKEEEFCKGKCPLSPGEFEHSTTETPPVDPKSPTNTTLTVETIFQMFNADKTELVCLKGPFSITFP